MMTPAPQTAARFDGKTAFVTGAASGMGKATAKLLAARGAQVALIDRQAPMLEAAVAEIIAGCGRAIAIVADVSKAGDMREAVERTVRTFGELRLAANIAGIAGDAAAIGDMAIDAWDETIAINLSGLFYGMRYQIPAMLAAGGGAIVNVSSVFADRGQDARPAYAAAKHGIRGLTRSVAVDYAAKGIRANEVQPGVIRTPMIDVDRPRAEAFAKHIPAKRLGEAEEVAAAVAFLLSDDAAYVNGAHLAVDGGFLA